jgi:hypothetical protein
MLNITTDCDLHPSQKKLAAHVEGQLLRLAEHLRLDCNLLLYPIEPRKGGSQMQGLRVQRYEPDEIRPAILLVAQPGNNATCWLWRLQFPRNTDPQLMYARFAEAIEEGWHLVEKKNGEPVANALPKAQPVSAAASVAPVEQFDVGKVLIDNDRMQSLLHEVYSRAITSGRGRTLSYQEASDEIQSLLKCSPRAAGSILASFRHRHWISRDKRDRTVTLLASGVGVVESQSTGTAGKTDANVTVPTAPAPQMQTLEEQVTVLLHKAAEYDQCKQLVEDKQVELQRLEGELRDLEEKRRNVLASIEAVKRALKDAHARQGDVYLTAAHAEFERIKARILGSTLTPKE